MTGKILWLKKKKNNTIFFTLNCCWIAEWTIMVVPEFRRCCTVLNALRQSFARFYNLHWPMSSHVAIKLLTCKCLILSPATCGKAQCCGQVWAPSF